MRAAGCTIKTAMQLAMGISYEWAPWKISCMRPGKDPDVPITKTSDGGRAFLPSVSLPGSPACPTYPRRTWRCFPRACGGRSSWIRRPRSRLCRPWSTRSFKTGEDRAQAEVPHPVAVWWTGTRPQNHCAGHKGGTEMNDQSRPELPDDDQGRDAEAGMKAAGTSSQDTRSP